MPYLFPDGTAVGYSPSYCPPDRYVSWRDLARDAGVPSWAREAEYGNPPHAKVQAQQAILDAYNRYRTSPLGELLNAVMVSARSRSGREWRVHAFSATHDEYRLRPLGADVQPATDGHGRMQGGVRDIRVSYADLHDPKKWRLVRRGSEE